MAAPKIIQLQQADRDNLKTDLTTALSGAHPNERAIARGAVDAALAVASRAVASHRTSRTGVEARDLVLDHVEAVLRGLSHDVKQVLGEIA